MRLPTTKNEMKYFAALSLLFLFSCKSIHIETPILDQQVVLDSLPDSELNIETEIDLKPYLQSAENDLDKKFYGEENNCEGISFKYHFERDPLAFSFKNKALQYQVTGRFDLSLSYCPKCVELFGDNHCATPRIYASCGINEPKVGVKLNYKTEFDVSKNFQLTSKTKLQDFQLVDPCKITVFNYDASEKIEQEVVKELVKLERDIDKQIERAPVRETMQDVWSNLQEPIEVAPYGYFYIQPKTIGVSLLHLENKKALLQTHITATPFFSTSTKSFQVHTLPDNHHFSSAPTSELSIRVFCTYDSLSELLKDQMLPYAFDVREDKKINVDDIRVLGIHKGKLVFQVSFSGYKKGVLYVSSVPYIDENQILRTKDLTYILETINPIVKTASWLFSKQLIDKIETDFYYDLNPLLKETQTTFEQQLNTELTKGVFLTCKIDHLSVSHLQLLPSELCFDLGLLSQLKLKIK